jgi:hypothetical protein
MRLLPERVDAITEGEEDIMKEKISYACSDDYHMFVELGYPQLDKITYSDGEWAIREFYTQPIMPAYTQWRVIFSGFRNVEFNRSFVQRMIAMIDLEKAEFWERMEEEAAEKKKAEESALNARVDMHVRTAQLLTKNDPLMNRAAKVGPSAFSLDSLLREMSPHQVRSVLGSSVQTFC